MRIRSIGVTLAVTTALVVAAFGCTSTSPGAAETSATGTTSAALKSDFLGFSTTEYRPSKSLTWDWNRCVPDPVGQVERLRMRGDVIGTNMGAGFPDVDEDKNHWQGLVRLPVGPSNLFAMDARFGDGSRLGIARISGSSVATGRRIRGNRMSTTQPDWDVAPPAQDAILWKDLISTGHVHPGGMQTLGSHLFVPLEESGALIVNYDVSQIGTFPCTQGVNCPSLRWALPLSMTGGAAAFAGVAKLADGRYVLATAEKDTTVIHFLVSKDPSRAIDDPQVFDGALHGAIACKLPNGESCYYQHLSVLTACSTSKLEPNAGALYVLASGSAAREKSGDDMVHLFELGLTNGGDPAFPGTDLTVAMNEVASRHLYCSSYPSSSYVRQCDFLAAVGTYVDPEGRLLVYASEHDNDGPNGSVKMMEFRPTDHLDQPGTGAVEGCATNADAFVELYDGPIATIGATPPAGSFMIDFPDRNRRSLDFGPAYAMNDRVRSIRYCLPPGLAYRVWGEAGLWGARADFFGDATLVGTGPSSNGAIQTFEWPSNKGWSSGCFTLAGSTTCLPDGKL